MSYGYRRCLIAEEKKEYERDRRKAIEGMIENLFDEDDKYSRVQAHYEDKESMEKLLDSVIGFLDGWELDYTDENIKEGLEEIIWGEN